jgi:nicotinamidase-related amidase
LQIGGWKKSAEEKRGKKTWKKSVEENRAWSGAPLGVATMAVTHQRFAPAHPSPALRAQAFAQTFKLSGILSTLALFAALALIHSNNPPKESGMITIEPHRTALLVMDFQSEVVTMLGERAAAALERVGGLIAAARKANVPIIYIVVGFRPGYPELNPRNASFAAVAHSGRFVGATPGAEVAAAIRPVEGDVVVVKHRVSAFAGTDLEMILRAKAIDTLVLCGIATSGVVLSTARHAADADYRLVVVADCCADRDDEVHRVLTEKVFVRQATVTSASELTAALDQG